MRVKRAGAWLALIFAALSLPLNAQQTDGVPGRSGLGVMAWLVGDWHAVSQTQAGARKLPQVGSRFRLELDGRMVTLRMSQAGRDFLNGMFVYDGAKKAVTFWYVVNDPEDAESEDNGTLAAGVVKPLQDTLLLDWSATRPDGATGHLQTRIERMDADHYRWEVFVDYPGEGLQKLNEVLFARGPG